MSARHIVIDFQSYLQLGPGEEGKIMKGVEGIEEIWSKGEEKGVIVSLYFPVLCKEIEKFQILLTKKNKSKENTENNQESKANIVVGPQCLFFELGFHSSAGHETVVYSNNPNFFHRRFVDMLKQEYGSNKNIPIKHRRMERLDEDLKLMRLVSKLANIEESKIDPRLIKHNKEITYQINVKEENKDIETGISESQTMAGLSTTSGSTAYSEIDKEMEELERKFDLDKDYKKSLAVLLEKIPKYFNKTDDNNVIKFMNGLGNLTTQHLNKFEKLLKSRLSQIERTNYFLSVRNFLCENEIIKCEVLNLWVHTHHGDTEEKMKDSYTVKIDFDKIDTVLAELKENEPKLSLKGHKLIDNNFNIYGEICYAAVINLTKNNLMSSDKPISSVKSLTQNIHHVLKDIYNSKAVTKDQKYVIKKDKKIKYMIAEILKYNKIWEEQKDGSIIINKEKCEVLLNELETWPSQNMIDRLIGDIEEIISEEHDS
ncbi:unnamed protein product [Moneuplotes crassus]|uniref:Uncharacterized protein n=1 Tax=Euplotes crassus TaxID=5936 RepID=A0AAD1X5H5_EUPCR|nr:unnamed protein product [Moneuplotes crassus]